MGHLSACDKGKAGADREAKDLATSAVRASARHVRGQFARAIVSRLTPTQRLLRSRMLAGLTEPEARLFQFTGLAHGEGEPPVKQVAACDLREAIAYLRKWYPDFDILRVEFVTMIEILSGSPLN